MNGLISTQVLDARLGEAGLVILDMRSGGGARAEFAAAHIPGARHTDYAADGWRARVGNAPGMLPNRDHLTALFSRLGLAADQSIVVVPAGGGVSELAAAARIYWTLKACGLHPIAILDGGMAAWLAEGRPTESGTPVITPGSFTPTPAAPEVRADAAAVLSAMEAGESLLDARSPSYFAGLEKAPEAGAAGHIPGALNIDYTLAYDPLRQRLRPRAELDRLFAAVPATPVVSYCNTGHTAALNWFVLSEVLGRPGIRLYDGSMTDWTQDPDRPVAVLI